MNEPVGDTGDELAGGLLTLNRDLFSWTSLLACENSCLFLIRVKLDISLVNNEQHFRGRRCVFVVVRGKINDDSERIDTNV